MAKKNLDDENEELLQKVLVDGDGMPRHTPEPIVSGLDIPPVIANSGTEPTRPNPPDPWMIMDRMVKAIEALGAREGGADSKVMETLAAAMARMAESNIEGSRIIAEENRKAHRPSNMVIPNVSVFNRRGTELADYDFNGVVIKKPPLKCLMMIPWLAEWESLTREEVELLNLLEPGDYSIRRVDRTKVSVNVQIRYKEDNQTPTSLILTHETAFNNDNFRMMPALTDMLRDVLKQHDREISKRAAVVLSDEEEEALIEAGELSVSV